MVHSPIHVFLLFSLTITIVASLPDFPPHTDRYTTYQGKILKYMGPEGYRNRNRPRMMDDDMNNGRGDHRSLDDSLDENGDYNEIDPRIRRFSREIPVEISLPEGYLEYALTDALTEWNETGTRLDLRITYFERETNYNYLEAQRRFESLTSQMYYHDIQLQQKITLLEKASKVLLETVEAEVHSHHNQWVYPTLALGISILGLVLLAIVIMRRTPSKRYYQLPTSFV